MKRWMKGTQYIFCYSLYYYGVFFKKLEYKMTPPHFIKRKEKKKKKKAKGRKEETGSLRPSFLLTTAQ